MMIDAERGTSPHLPRSSTWSAGQRKGSSRAEPGMVPWCGAHHRSAPHHRSGSTSALPRMLAIASAFLSCTQQLLSAPGADMHCQLKDRTVSIDEYTDRTEVFQGKDARAIMPGKTMTLMAEASDDREGGGLSPVTL